MDWRSDFSSCLDLWDEGGGVKADSPSQVNRSLALNQQGWRLRRLGGEGEAQRSIITSSVYKSKQQKETQTNRNLRYTCLCGPEWLCSSPAAGGAFTHTHTHPLMSRRGPCWPASITVMLHPLVSVGSTSPEWADSGLVRARPAHLKGPSLLVKKEQLLRDRRFHRAYLDRNTVQHLRS